MRLPFGTSQLLRGMALVGMMSGAANAGDCLAVGSQALFFPQNEGYSVGSVWGTFTGNDCFYDIKVPKGWTVRLASDGPVSLSLTTAGYSRTDPLQPFEVKTDSAVRLLIKRTTKRGADFAYEVKMDLRAPGH